MKIIFIDETENSTHLPGFYAVCGIAVDATKYKTVRMEIDKALDGCSWNRDHEFKGACMFSPTKGDPAVTVDQRIDASSRMVSATMSKANARTSPVVAWTDAGSNVESHLSLVKTAIAGCLKQKPSGKNKGKDLCLVFLDKKMSVPYKMLSTTVRDAVQSRGYYMGEDIVLVDSSCSWPGVLLADILAYMAMWIYAYHKLGSPQPSLFDTGGVTLSATIIKKIEAVQAVLENGSELTFIPKLGPHVESKK